MLKVHPDMQKALRLLVQGEKVEVPFEGAPINLRLLEDASKLNLTTSVYNGSNYIPKSVRRGISQNLFMGYPTLPTYLSVDEQKFQINLNYFGDAEMLNQHDLHELLQEFSLIAHKWREVLDEHDKNDLVHVRV